MKKQIKTIVKQIAVAATRLSVRHRWMLDASTLPDRAMRLRNQYGETPQQEYARIMKGVSVAR
jgi:hypothetical protein